MCNFNKDDNTAYMYYETKPISDYCHGSLINGSHNTYMLNMAALIHIRMLHTVYTRKKPDFSEPLISKASWGSGTGEDTALMINVTD